MVVKTSRFVFNIHVLLQSSGLKSWGLTPSLRVLVGLGRSGGIRGRILSSSQVVTSPPWKDMTQILNMLTSFWLPSIKVWLYRALQSCDPANRLKNESYRGCVPMLWALDTRIEHSRVKVQILRQLLPLHSNSEAHGSASGLKWQEKYMFCVVYAIMWLRLYGALWELFKVT